LPPPERTTEPLYAGIRGRLNVMKEGLPRLLLSEVTVDPPCSQGRRLQFTRTASELRPN